MSSSARSMAGRATALSRSLLCLLVVVLPLGVAACGGKPSPRPVAQRFLDAVARGDYASAASAAGVTVAPVRDAYRSFLGALAAPRLELRLGAVQADAAGTSAQATFDATVVPAGLGTLRYTGHLSLQRGTDGWQVRWSPTDVHPALTTGRHVALTREAGRRAPVLGGDGSALVADAPVVTIGVHPRALAHPAAEIAALARILRIDGATIARDVAAAPPDAFVPVITLRRPAFEQARTRLDALPGVPYRAGTAPLAPTPTFARALLGRVGPATKEALDRLGAPYRARDQVGLYGIQAAFEHRLAGSPTAEVVVEDARGARLQTLATFRGRPGRSVRVTLDRRVQAAAERALDAPAIRERRASLVAVRASTGEILAVANRPAESSYDTALVGRYPPGSTFKVVTATALLGDGLRLTDPVPCPPSIDVSGKRFTNFQGESAPGDVPFRTDFALSCNTAFVGLSSRLGASDLRAAAAAYGIGGAWQLPLDSFSGSVPVATDAVERAADAIGQGRVLVSPLDMAMVAATVDSGTWHAPQLLVDPAPAAQPSPKALAAPVAASLRALMRAVVTDGTAKQALGRLPGPPVHGKTGTAEFGSADPPLTHAWFIGYRGDLAFAVLVEGGGVGGAVAAPVAASFLRALDRS
ncbi:MAG: penicillin-binding transpeptidase domain-containing protein [Frankiaceae bacterium]